MQRTRISGTGFRGCRESAGPGGGNDSSKHGKARASRTPWESSKTKECQGSHHSGGKIKGRGARQAAARVADNGGAAGHKWWWSWAPCEQGRGGGRRRARKHDDQGRPRVVQKRRSEQGKEGNEDGAELRRRAEMMELGGTEHEARARQRRHGRRKQKLERELSARRDCRKPQGGSGAAG